MAVENNEKEKSKEKVTKKRGTSISGIFRGFKAEFKRITWPTQKEIKKASGAVVVLCAIYVLYVGVLDYAFTNLFDLIFK